jgi:hypothetical protein
MVADDALRRHQARRFAVRAVRGRWLALVAYASSMAYVEAAAVLYLRTIYGGVDPVGPRHTPFQPLPDFIWIEIGREAATMAMLGTVGWLAGRGLAGRIGAFAVSMGVWDVLYYVFLWLFTGWPGSLLAPDVLFLIPVPWWGPVVAPGLLAVVMVGAGSAAMAREAGGGLPRPTLGAWLLLLGGAGLCLVAFMADALLALPRGLEAAYYARGGAFAWPIYGLGLVLIAVGLVHALISGPLPEAPPRPSSRRVGLRRLWTGTLELLDLGR